MEYIEVLGGLEGEHFLEFKRLFRDGFEAARKHSDGIISGCSRFHTPTTYMLIPYAHLALVELMQKDSTLPCFTAYGEQTSQLLRERFQPNLTHAAVEEFADKLIMTSLASAWTRLYDSVSDPTHTFHDVLH